MQLQKANTRVGRPILLLAQFLHFSIEQNLHKVKSSLGQKGPWYTKPM